MFKTLATKLLQRLIKAKEINKKTILRGYENTMSKANSWRNKLSSFKDMNLQARRTHLLLGASGICIYYFRFTPDETEDEDNQYSQKKRWRVKVYRVIPWRTVSRLWGWFCKREFPGWINYFILSSYITRFQVDLSEAERQNIQDYKSLADLFGRKLKPGVRPINPQSSIVSPCDGIVTHFGKADESGRLEQVKGISYSISKFLGLKDTPEGNNNNHPGKPLYFCVIYLSPGAYHGFHSPVKWKVNLRRHFRGELLSVGPSIASWIPGLFALNERVVYMGEWEHGFFSMIPVGATNVGSIKVYQDPDLSTNSTWKWKQTRMNEKNFESPFNFEKGDSFGEFNLGSTVVLVFDAPEKFQFSLQVGQRIQYGQSLT